MVYAWDLTDNDAGALQAPFINVMPLYSPPVIVAPPQDERNLSVIITEDPVQIGSFRFVSGGRVTAINQEFHEALLSQSLEEYGDIWRNLAQR